MVQDRRVVTITPLTGYIIWPISIRVIYNDLQWPWRSFACCSTYQMQFDEHLCDISHCFNRRGASRGPSAIAELLVYTSDNTRVLTFRGACYIPTWYTRPKTVTHPGTNRARRALTSFMRRTPLTTTPRRQKSLAHTNQKSQCAEEWRPIHFVCTQAA